MDPMFASGPGPVRRWLRAYRLPLAMTALFFVTLAAFAAAPNPNRASAERTELPQVTEPPPERSPCIACELGKECDESGQCVFPDQTPFPCEPGTSFDPEEGFCLPDATPEPTAPPTKTLRPARGFDATPRPTPAEPDPVATSDPSATPREPATPRPQQTPEATPPSGDGT